MTNPVIDSNGNQTWGTEFCHRENGPAFIGTTGIQAWYINGDRHRTDGPAVIDISGRKEWYINGEMYIDNKSFQEAAGVSDEDMAAIVLKYGNVE